MKLNNLCHKIRDSKEITIIYQLITRVLYDIISIFRKISKRGKYAHLKKYKNIHKGERCFIMCTGPSLNYHDIHLLENEYTFGMNSLCLGFREDTFRPTYFGIQDINVYNRVKEALCIEEDLTIFISSYLERKCKVNKKNWNVLPYNGIYNSFEMKYFHKKKVRFGNDISCMVYDGYSITYTLMQVAAYMGFKEIYLIGADCNYTPGKQNHFIEHGNSDPVDRMLLAKELMEYSYAYAKKILERKNIHIYNATRGGMLEIFPRVNLEDVLSVSHSNEGMRERKNEK